jgi:hypothetical protein
MKSMNILLVGAMCLTAPALAAGSAAAQTCVDAPPGLVSWWPGDSSGADVASGFDATLANGASYMPGLVGDAFFMDGVAGGQDDRVDLPSQALNGLANFTVEMWVNTTDPDEGAIMSAANAATGGDNEFLLFQTQSPADVAVYLKQATSGRLPVILNDGSWHHVAFAREGDTGHLYVDGMLAGSIAYPTGPVDVAPGGLLLGQEQDCLGGCFNGNQAFDGLVDELAVYGRALSADEVLAIFDAGSAGKCKPQPEPSVDEELLLRVEDLEAAVDALTDQMMELEAAMESMSGHTHDDADCDDDHGRHHRFRKWRKHNRH